MLFILIFILSLATSYVLPWWAAAAIAFVLSIYAGTKPAQAFWSGFGSVFLVWVVLALFKSIPNNHILATRVAQLFGLPHWLLLLFITALIGGLVGGIASLAGLYVKRIFEKPATEHKAV
ncbi:hypothetical protein [Mucilaginibacter aquatilis]|uniref:Uncharacterized protein n=1 Tax=Mucilaginibacter aquatilis TaxID=1517760 RepID=A0A6I4I7V2_9SPHI|nr:hypothetical protein [Mucilaginibacter aquatilis]MVN89549.1 hypothetical protein [Mucilaginibacter aquatilis]